VLFPCSTTTEHNHFAFGEIDDETLAVAEIAKTVKHGLQLHRVAR
jgi:hypothetical protein